MAGAGADWHSQAAHEALSQFAADPVDAIVRLRQPLAKAVMAKPLASSVAALPLSLVERRFFDLALCSPAAFAEFGGVGRCLQSVLAQREYAGQKQRGPL